MSRGFNTKDETTITGNATSSGDHHVAMITELHEETSNEAALIEQTPANVVTGKTTFPTEPQPETTGDRSTKHVTTKPEVATFIESITSGRAPKSVKQTNLDNTASNAYEKPTSNPATRETISTRKLVMRCLSIARFWSFTKQPI